MIIAVTGVIGCGKSSLVKALCECYPTAVPFYEPLPETDNFMLEAYYKDPARYAYSMQTLLLSLRFQAQQEAQWRSLRGQLCIMDSTIYSDKAFLEVQRDCGYIDELEYKAYCKLCEIHFGFLQYPDLLIHIDLDTTTEIDRICERSRACESDIDTSYLIKLRDAYNDLIPYLGTLFPVKYIDGRQSKQEVLQDAIALIEKRRRDMTATRFYPVYKHNTGVVYE